MSDPSGTPSSTTQVAEEIHRLVDETVHIETPPDVLMRVQDLVAQPDVPIRKLVAVIELDSGLASRVLRLVNGASYGMKQEISSLQLACVVLGLKTIRQLVIQASVVDRFAQAPTVEGFDPGRLWRHSFETAVVARFLHTYCEDAVRCGATESYTCGLLHDVGKMVLLQQRTVDFAEAVRLSCDEGLTLEEAERRVFGFAAFDVAGRLAEVWRLGSSVQAAVMRGWDRHTHPVEWSTASMIHAASSLAHAASGHRGGWNHESVEEATMLELGITPEASASVQELVLRTKAENEFA